MLNHTRWMLPRERSAATDNVEPPEVIAEREQIRRLALAMGQLAYDRRTALDLPELFPWARFLPEADLQTFAAEVVDTIRAANAGSTSPSMAQLLIAWQHTAEAHSDPDLLAALTREHDEDHGPAADPQDV